MECRNIYCEQDVGLGATKGYCSTTCRREASNHEPSIFARLLDSMLKRILWVILLIILVLVMCTNQSKAQEAPHPMNGTVCESVDSLVQFYNILVHSPDGATLNDGFAQFNKTNPKEGDRCGMLNAIAKNGKIVKTFIRHDGALIGVVEIVTPTATYYSWTIIKKPRQET